MNRWRTYFWGFLGTGAAVALLWFGTPRLKGFLKQDTLAPYKKKTGADDHQPMITLRDSDIQLFFVDKLVGKATVKEIDLDKDRSTILMRGITKGEYSGKDGPSFQYAATRGTWQKNIGVLNCDGEITVRNKDFNLKTNAIFYRQADQELRIDNTVKGGFLGGQIEAKQLKYRLQSKAFTVGPITWTGPLQDKDSGTKKTIWKFSAPGGGSSPDGVTTTYKNATATDGEIIVKADTIVSNRDTGVMVATGNVKYFGKDANMSCPKATVFRKERRVVLEGQVSLLIKADDSQVLKEESFEPLRPVVPDSIAAGRPADPSGQDKELDKEVISPGNKRKYPVKVLANRIEYWYRRGQRRATITGSPQARQDLPGGRWRQVWADKAFYNGETDKLRLEDSVRMRSSRGDDMRTTWFEVSTKDGDESWKSGGTQGEFIEEGIEEDETTPPA